MESLSDRLKALGVKMGTGSLSKPKPRLALQRPIETVIEGTDYASHYGNAFVVEKTYPLDYNHGSTPLRQAADLKLLALWGKSPRLAQTDLEKVVFLDTETSGLAGGTGTYAFMVGFGSVTEQGFRLRQLFLRSPDVEDGLLAALSEMLTPYEAVVTFNGKSFDIPLLNARYILNRVSSPFSSFMHLDLLHLARRLWRNRLASRTLGDLEREILSVERTREEIPGWMIPELYFNYLKSGDASPLTGVFYHNTLDILSLAALFYHTAGLLADPLGCGMAQSLDLIAIAILYEDLGMLEEAAAIYAASLDQGLPPAFFTQTLMRFANLHRRRGERDKAVSFWVQAAGEGELSACIELAKHAEHQARDVEQAVYWTQQALEMTKTEFRWMGDKKMAEELNGRLVRLTNKKKN